jgi:hypothetical protein
MRYLKTFEANSHWSEFLYDKVKFDRIDDIKELTYPFLDDFDMRSDISFSFKKNGFDSPGRIQEYLSDDTNLHMAYFVQIHAYSPSILDIDKLLQFKEYEIDIINRLKDIGFIFKYSTGSNNYINIELYHKDDIVDKSLFLEGYSWTASANYSNKDIKSKDELFKFLQDKFGKISNIWMSASKNIIIDVDPFEKYTIDDLYKFVTKTLGDKYSVTKVSNNQNDESILSLKIGYK